ncbi:MAG TPA: hypothetical protein PKW95_09870 [bacterium]|nr:hypothetical protein [bacterium]
MSGRHEWTARLAVRVLQWAARLPRPWLLRLLRVAEKLPANRAPGPGLTPPVTELIEIIVDEPGGEQVIRRLLLEGRRAQYVSLVRGLLRHHASGGAKVIVAADEALPAVVSKEPLRVAVIGEGLDARLLRTAYQADPGSVLVEDDAARAYEFAPGATPEQISAALAKGAVVSVHHSLLTDAAAARALFASTKAPWRVFYPLWHFAPARRLHRLLADDEIGEVGTLRVQAILGGDGGALAPQSATADDYLRHPAFDHLLLLTWLGGAPHAVSACLQPLGEHGGQGMIAVRHRAPGRYGMLEMIHAPQMTLPSAYYPYAVEAEASGTDGIAWLRRGMAQPSREAPLAVRVGKSAYTIGVERGLTADWDALYAHAAAHLRSLAAGQAQPMVSAPDLFATLIARDKAVEAARTGRVATV